MAKPPLWPSVVDEALVERMIPAVQAAIITVSRDHQGLEAEAPVGIDAPDVANVLLMALATILEPSPSCRTPMGMRLTAGAAGKELAELIRDTRRLKDADLQDVGSIQ